MSIRSALYSGHVVHARHRPGKHRFKYRVFSLLLDLDEIETLGGTLKLFGHNRAALLSFHDADHGDLKGGNLKAWALDHLRSAGLAEDGMRFEILCYPRIFGYVFNPLTVYFCYRRDTSLAAILYEVCNTFNERHTYVLPVGRGQDSVRQSCEKELYVSPFMPMGCTYHFHIEPPSGNVAIRINETDADGPLLFAAFEGARTPLTDATLLRAFASHPLMTFKIMAGIHWEALRLWLKGMPFFRHNPANVG